MKNDMLKNSQPFLIKSENNVEETEEDAINGRFEMINKANEWEITPMLEERNHELKERKKNWLLDWEHMKTQYIHITAKIFNPRDIIAQDLMPKSEPKIFEPLMKESENNGKENEERASNEIINGMIQLIIKRFELEEKYDHLGLFWEPINIQLKQIETELIRRRTAIQQKTKAKRELEKILFEEMDGRIEILNRPLVEKKNNNEANEYEEYLLVKGDYYLKKKEFFDELGVRLKEITDEEDQLRLTADYISPLGDCIYYIIDPSFYYF